MSDDENPDEEQDDGADLLPTAMPTFDASDPNAIRRQRDEQIRLNNETGMFWRKCLESTVGRRVLWEFIAIDCRAFDVTFSCGPNGFPQTEATWFHYGQAALGMRLYRTLQRHDAANVLLMHREHDGAVQPEPKRRTRKKADG